MLIHPDAGVLSALGIGMANVVRRQVCGVYEPYREEAVEQLEPKIRELEELLKTETEKPAVPWAVFCSPSMRRAGPI